MAVDGSEGRADAGERRGGTRSPATALLAFRCHGCGLRFAGDAGGPGVCPRCGAIGGHARPGDP